VVFIELSGNGLRFDTDPVSNKPIVFSPTLALSIADTTDRYRNPFHHKYFRDGNRRRVKFDLLPASL